MLQMELVDSAFFALPYGLLRQFKTCTVYIIYKYPASRFTPTTFQQTNPHSENSQI